MKWLTLASLTSWLEMKPWGKKKTARKCFLVDNDFLELDFRWNKITSKKKRKKNYENETKQTRFVHKNKSVVDRRYVTKGTKTKGSRWCCQRSILSFHFVQPFSLKTSPRFIFDLNKSLNLVTVLMAQENAWMIFSNVFSVEWWMKGLCFELWEKENRLQTVI